PRALASHPLWSGPGLGSATFGASGLLRSWPPPGRHGPAHAPAKLVDRYRGQPLRLPPGCHNRWRQLFLPGRPLRAGKASLTASSRPRGPPLTLLVAWSRFHARWGHGNELEFHDRKIVGTNAPPAQRWYHGPVLVRSG